MKRSRLLRSAGVVGGVLGLMLVLHLIQGNRHDARFTAELQQLRQAGPEIVLAGETIAKRDVAAGIPAIQAIYDAHNEAWCNGDGDAYASVFTQDVDFISFDGTHTIGRTEVASSHQELFERFLPNTCLDGQITRLKFLDERTAIAYVVSGTRFGASELVRRPSIQTYVAVKRKQGWRFVSFHNGRIDRVQNRNIVRLMWLGLQTFVLRR